ncbi:mannosyl-oligosaccharide alpha-1,2-mannosidase [Marchantia polymorpha subsp. ruderalis]|uniref:alpha-1,2-Mannosidase n=2 Tax=Marchantia polymorpha TaxID=3197 RepID=A0AAF6AM05_MARPO|nr:hypothetical protein MARPO_0005s0011 [Marchantia polymorpha]BBM97475.1 hypothetical protein Mp_1g05980 [Marchantia polymorpha subsp. ruderalis]|eukprot:PTQ48330.1 hypothetical protein MARPO_0005s0011 [Marchantia polymorpha]
MARQRSQSSWLRGFSLSYYLRRPRKLAFVLVFFVISTFLIWDRQTIIREHEVAISEVSKENYILSQKLEDLRKFVKQKVEVEDIPRDLDLGDDQDGDIEIEDKPDVGDDDSRSQSVKDRKSPQLNHVVLDGSKDAPADDDLVARERRDKVRGAMLHAWTSYETYAWGFDELRPMSKTGVNQFGGLGATIVDSLDTLYIMGFHEQFKKASEWVSQNMNFNKHYGASVFETTIRVLGGLLSAYDLSGDKMFLSKAQELAERLLPAWNTASGIPYNTIELATGSASNPQWTGGSSVLADIGTEQIEFIGLSQRTGNPKYKEKVENVIFQLKKVMPNDGLLPIYISPHSGKPTTTKITFGAMGDSFYEYLLKVWIQGNKTEVVKHYREMFDHSMEGMMTLVKKSSPSNYVYLAERTGDVHQAKMDELACFAPGMLALGVEGASEENAKKYLDLAKELARTCYNFYMSTRTKLAGENYHFRDGEDMSVGTAYNILRPETIESLMYLYRKTGDNMYRDWGWDIFQAFEANSRVPTGYVGLHDVNSGVKDDMMQSFFLAETLKYLYLLFSPSTVIPLDEWVFNTEAHPLRIIPRVNEPISLEEPIHEESRGRMTEQSRKEEMMERMRNSSGKRNSQKRLGRKEGRGGTLGSFDYR